MDLDNFESVEDNNVASIPVVIEKPDLTVIDNNIVQDTIGLSETVNLSARVLNDSPVQSPSSSLGIFASLDKVFSADDDFVVAVPTGIIAANDTSGVLNLSFSIPTDIEQGGRWYVIFVADYTETVDENDESNNYVLDSIYVALPDLIVIDNNIVQDTIGTSETVNLSASVLNASPGQSPSSSLGIFTSLDPVFSEDDTFVDAVFTSSIAANDTSAVLNLSFSIPADVEQGGRLYIFFVADYTETVKEKDESNNYVLDSIYVVLPDLIIIDPDLAKDTLAIPGGRIEASSRVVNLGTSPSASNNMYFYLSEDNVFDEVEDIFLNSSNISFLPAGDSVIVINTFLDLPDSLPAGNYYIIFQADATSDVTEANEDNNLNFAMFRVLNPDLTIAGGMADPDTLRVGDLTAINVDVTNIGDSTSLTYFLEYYFSEDDVLDATDLFLSISSTQSALDPGDTTFAISANLLIPDTTAGSYHIIVKVDATNRNVETDETNNVEALMIVIAEPDLTITNLNALPPVIGSGFASNFSLDVTNSGLVDAPSNTGGFVLSLDNILSEDDILIHEDSSPDVHFVPQIDHDSTLTFNAQLRIPSDVEEGPYYVIAIIDALEEIRESDEGNNQDSIMVTITVPDLTISNVEAVEISDFTTAQDSVSAGSTIGIKATDLNITNRATVHQVRYYLSTDSQLDTLDFMFSNISLVIDTLANSEFSILKQMFYLYPQILQRGNTIF